MVITCLFTCNTALTLKRDKTDTRTCFAALCVCTRQWGMSLKVRFIFCPRINSKMPTRESKDSFIPLLLLHLPYPACITPSHSTSHHTVSPCWPRDSSSCYKPLFSLSTCWLPFFFVKRNRIYLYRVGRSNLCYRYINHVLENCTVCSTFCSEVGIFHKYCLRSENQSFPAVTRYFLGQLVAPVALKFLSDSGFFLLVLDLSFFYIKHLKCFAVHPFVSSHSDMNILSCECSAGL